MRMMSLLDSAHYLSWAFHFGTTFTIIAFLIVAVGGSRLFQYSDLGFIFIYYLVFFYSTIAFSFFMATFFSHSKTASILGVLPYFGGYFITLALSPTSSKSAKLAASLHPSAAFTLAMTAFTEWEDSAIGITRYTFNTSATSNFSFADAIGMMFLDIFLYTFLAWYNDKVWPSEFGTRLPP
jgi:ATP-binding cassette, subfamily A (ABC1), member 3